MVHAALVCAELLTNLKKNLRSEIDEVEFDIISLDVH